MAAPANTTIETAVPLTAATVTQTVSDGTTTYTVWYRYTAAATDTWVSVWGLGDLTTYQPLTSVWLGPTSAPTPYLGIQGRNVPLQVPVTGGTTYYLKIAPNAGNPSPAVLTLSLVRGPQLAVPAGSIAVPDDTDGFPLVFLQRADGAAVASVAPFPAGEAADVLPSGVVAMADGWHSTINVYDASFTELASLPFADAGSSFGFIRAHAPSDAFFVGARTTGQVRTITAAGAFGAMTWTTGTTGLLAIAVNQAGTVLYYADTLADQVLKWNLSTNVTAGLLVAYPAGFNVTDLLVLADDTVVIGAVNAGGTTTRVQHVSTAGAVLHTYDFTGLDAPNGTFARLATAIEDPASFWIWTHHAGGISRFRRIQVSDGTALETIETTEFETGSYQGTPTLTPRRFGPSFSCPFWITRTPRAAGEDGGGGDGGGLDPPYVAPASEMDTRVIRRLRRAPHVNKEHQRLFFRAFELDLERGQGLVTGQGEDPLVTLRLSRDGGQTWGEPISMHAGRLGAYQQRVQARRLGQARDTVFEVTVSDPIAWSLVAAWLDLEPGTS